MIDTFEVYARARIVFGGRPETRLYMRRDPHRRAWTVFAEEQVDGRLVRTRIAVWDELRHRGDVPRLERLLRTGRAYHAQHVGLVLMARQMRAMGDVAREALQRIGAVTSEVRR